MRWAVISIVCVLVSVPCYGKYSGGSGDPNDPFLIAEPNDIVEMSDSSGDWGGHFLMIADVNMVDYSFDRAVIAPDFPDTSNDFDGVAFVGTFDGNGHVISNLFIDANDVEEDYVGLFGCVDSDGVIKGVSLEDFVFVGGSNCDIVGGLVGYVVLGSISDCLVTVRIVAGEDSWDTGGLIGRIDHGDVDNCHGSGEVSGNDIVGGLIGRVQKVELDEEVGRISGCSFSGRVTSNRLGAGGLIGYNLQADVVDCYSDCTVSGDRYAGGLIGLYRQSQARPIGKIMNCYALGNVDGVEFVGGLIGSADGGVGQALLVREVGGYHVAGQIDDVISCYATGNVSASEWYAGGLIGYNCTKVVDCYATGDVFAEQSDGGGLAGCNRNTIIGCRAEGNVSGGGRLGGLIGGHTVLTYGHPDNLTLVGEVRSCIATGTVTGVISEGGSLSADHCGGLIGAATGWVTPPWYEGAKPVLPAFVNRCGAYGDVLSEGDYVGGLIGEVSVEDDYLEYNGDAVGLCSASGTVEGNDYVGGLVGKNNFGKINSCSVDGSVVSGGWHVGGLVGYNEGMWWFDEEVYLFRGVLSRCYAICSTAGESHVGGLVGYTFAGLIEDCYSQGSVEGNERIGGLIGRNSGPGMYSDGAILERCYAACVVSGEIGVGGFVGFGPWYPFASGCFWDLDVSGQNRGWYGEGKTTDDMQTMSTFTDAGWDFVGEDVNGVGDIWRMCVDGVSHPRLSWEYSVVGDFACADGVGIEDLVYLAGRWLMEDEAAGAGDADGDGRVDMRDFGVMLGGWGQGGE